MPVTVAYRERVEALLEAALPVRTRSMFGGVGIYSGNAFFALIADDRLYFKVDDSTRGDFESAGTRPFAPFGEDRYTMSYYEVPADVLDDPVQLREWARKALAVAKKKPRRPRKR